MIAPLLTQSGTGGVYPLKWATLLITCFKAPTNILIYIWILHTTSMLFIQIEYAQQFNAKPIEIDSGFNLLILLFYN